MDSRSKRLCLGRLPPDHNTAFSRFRACGHVLASTWNGWFSMPQQS